MNFRFLNVPVFIQPTFWVFLLLFSFDPGGSIVKMSILALVLALSLIFHEYGHALAAKKMGVFPEITLEGFGGYTSYSTRGLNQSQQFLITLSGPLFTALLIGLSYYLLKTHLMKEFWAVYFAYIMMKLNIYWLIVNLAPLQPLDGGKIIAYLLRRLCGLEKGEWYALILGNFAAILGAAYFFTTSSYMFAWIFLFYGFRNFQEFRLVQKNRKPTAFSQYHEALRASNEGDKKKAIELFSKLIKSNDEYIKTHSIEGLADLLDKSDERAKAYKLLNSNTEKISKGKWLLCKLAYQEKNYELVARFSREIYEIHPALETALLNAKTYTHLNDFEYAKGWLKTALQFEEAKSLKWDEVFSGPEFEKLKNFLDTLKSEALPL